MTVPVRPLPRWGRLGAWVVAANLAGLALALMLAAPVAAEEASGAVREFVAWCGVG